VAVRAAHGFVLAAFCLGQAAKQLFALLFFDRAVFVERGVSIELYAEGYERLLDTTDC
jgi:hypothetical protein